MIAGNQTWVAALGKQQKQPLYVLMIPWFGLCLASFSPANPATAPTTGGWGIILWGVGGWGT